MRALRNLGPGEDILNKLFLKDGRKGKIRILLLCCYSKTKSNVEEYKMSYKIARTNHEKLRMP